MYMYDRAGYIMFFHGAWYDIIIINIRKNVQKCLQK